MKRILAVLIAAVMLMSAASCNCSKKNSANSGDAVSDITSSENQNDGKTESSLEEGSDSVSSEQEESAESKEKTVDKMYTSKKDIKNNGHYILYTDETWSYQNDAVSLMVSDEEDIKDIKAGISSGELYEITEEDLNIVPAG